MKYELLCNFRHLIGIGGSNTFLFWEKEGVINKGYTCIIGSGGLWRAHWHPCGRSVIHVQCIENENAMAQYDFGLFAYHPRVSTTHARQAGRWPRGLREDCSAPRTHCAWNRPAQLLRYVHFFFIIFRFIFCFYFSFFILTRK